MTLLLIMILANTLAIWWLIDEVQILIDSVQLLFEQNEVNDVLSEFEVGYEERKND